MKRSEWLKLMDMAEGWYGDGGGWYYDDREAGYYDGKDSAYETARDELTFFLQGVEVEEDVELCPSPFLRPNVTAPRPHELGSKPYAEYSHTVSGCVVCLEHFNAQRAKT